MNIVCVLISLVPRPFENSAYTHTHSVCQALSPLLKGPGDKAGVLVLAF